MVVDGIIETPEISKVEKTKEDAHWLSETLTPDLIERVRAYPAHREWTPERIILESLIGKLVESGQELDPNVRSHLRDLVWTFRWLAFSNMRPEEQAFIKRWAEADTVKASERQIEITPEVAEDIRWIWERFNLAVPTDERAKRLLGDTRGR